MTETEISAASFERYGHDVTTITALAALWLAAYLAEEHGAHGPTVWKQIDRMRARVEHTTMYPPYGHVCFPVA